MDFLALNFFPLFLCSMLCWLENNGVCGWCSTSVFNSNFRSLCFLIVIFTFWYHHSLPHSCSRLHLAKSRNKALIGWCKCWVRGAGGMREQRFFLFSFINWLLLSLHLEIRNNDRINLDYRSAIKTILLTMLGGEMKWVLQLYSRFTSWSLNCWVLKLRTMANNMKNEFEREWKGSSEKEIQE